MGPKVPCAAANCSLSVGWSWGTPPCLPARARLCDRSTKQATTKFEFLGPPLGRRHHAKQPLHQTPPRCRLTRTSRSTRSPRVILLLGERCRTPLLQNPLAIRNRRRTPAVPPGVPPLLLRRARQRVRPSLRGSTRPRRGGAGGARRRRRGSNGSATSIGYRTVLKDACERSSSISVYLGSI